MSFFLKKILDWFKNLFWSKDVQLSIVGLQNAGKSTLVNSLSTGKFDSDTIPTIGFNHRTFKKGNAKLDMWDLGGQPRFREAWEKYCRDADGIVFVVDAADKGNIDVARNQLHHLLSWQSIKGIPLLVLGNKNDLPDSLTSVELVKAFDLDSLKERTVACYSISAKNQVNLDITLKWLTSLQVRKKK